MMSSPQYIAQRINDRYELVAADQADSSRCPVSNSMYVIGGGALALYGLHRWRWFNAALTAVGAGLVYRGLSGRNPLEVISEKCAQGQDRKSESARRSPPPRRSGTIQWHGVDPVEQASMESFPASDSPSYTH